MADPIHIREEDWKCVLRSFKKRTTIEARCSTFHSSTGLFLADHFEIAILFSRANLSFFSARHLIYETNFVVTWTRGPEEKRVSSESCQSRLKYHFETPETFNGNKIEWQETMNKREPWKNYSLGCAFQLSISVKAFIWPISWLDASWSVQLILQSDLSLMCAQEWRDQTLHRELIRSEITYWSNWQSKHQLELRRNKSLFHRIYSKCPSKNVRNYETFWEPEKLLEGSFPYLDPTLRVDGKTKILRTSNYRKSIFAKRSVNEVN